MKTSSWIEEYISLLRQDSFNEALALKVSKLPCSFYRHQPLNTNSLNCLELNAVWMSSAHNLNDPFESALCFNDHEFALNIFKDENFVELFKKHYGKEISNEEVSEIINSSSPNKLFQNLCHLKKIEVDFSATNEIQKTLIQSYMDSERRKIKLCSFTERNDSILMWSHYSNQHRGICLDYDFKNSPTVHEFLEPVYYSMKVFSIMPYFGKSKRPYARSAVTIKSISKALDWRYEREWRLVFPVREDQFENGYYKAPLPSAIYLGARFDQNDSLLKDGLAFLATSHNIPLIKMKTHPSEYKIVPI